VDGIPFVAAYETEMLVVTYEWGPWDTRSPRPVALVRKNRPQPYGPAKDVTEQINPVWADDWLTRPLWAHDHL
jgi:hypothetical protein